MNYMTGWDESQIRRAMFRMALLVRRGLTAHLSEWWADRLTVRDKERDDRRICLECSSLQRDGKCFQVQQGVMRGVSPKHEPVSTILQRCDYFSWQKP